GVSYDVKFLKPRQCEPFWNEGARIFSGYLECVPERDQTFGLYCFPKMPVLVIVELTRLGTWTKTSGFSIADPKTAWTEYVNTTRPTERMSHQQFILMFHPPHWISEGEPTWVKIC